MCKSNWRLKFISKSVMSRIIKEALNFKINKKRIKIISKSSTIPKSLNNITFLIHRGINYRMLKIVKPLIGFKFGEFILTRKPHVYIKKIKNKKTK